MNIDIIKYPLTTFYAKIAVHEHSEMREELLSLISKVTSDPHPYIDKLDWASGKDLNDRDWILKVEPVIRKYVSAMAIACKYKGPIFEAMWFQQYVKEGLHDWHTHSGQWVGVYYLEMPENAPKTELISPFNGEVIEVDAKEGDIIMFPSHIIHRAPQVTEDLRKTIVSWNLLFEDTEFKSI